GRIPLSCSQSHGGVQEEKPRSLASCVSSSTENTARKEPDAMQSRDDPSNVQHRQLLQVDRPTAPNTAYERGDQCFRPKRLGSSEKERLRGDKRKLDELQLRCVPRKGPRTLLRRQSPRRAGEGKGP